MFFKCVSIVNLYNNGAYGLIFASRGLPEVFAKEKKKRLSAIANYLNEGNYDVVCLQELWCIGDFKLIKSICNLTLPYAQYFHR